MVATKHRAKEGDGHSGQFEARRREERRRKSLVFFLYPAFEAVLPISPTSLSCMACVIARLSRAGKGFGFG